MADPEDRLLDEVSSKNSLDCAQYRLVPIEEIEAFKGVDLFFIVDGFSASDVVQGNIGSCVLLATLQALTAIDDIIDTMVCQPNNLKSPKNVSLEYFTTGNVQFHLGRRIVSTKLTLPVSSSGKVLGVGGKLKPDKQNRLELWPALVEKAYAKILGSYDILTNGMQTIKFLKDALPVGETEFSSSAIVDLSINKLCDTWCRQASNVEVLNSVVYCSSLSKRYGTVPNHQYSSIRIFKPQHGYQKPAVVLRNPHSCNPALAKTSSDGREKIYESTALTEITGILNDTNLAKSEVPREYAYIVPEVHRIWANNKTYRNGRISIRNDGIFCRTFDELKGQFDDCTVVTLNIHREPGPVHINKTAHLSGTASVLGYNPILSTSCHSNIYVTDKLGPFSASGSKQPLWTGSNNDFASPAPLMVSHANLNNNNNNVKILETPKTLRFSQATLHDSYNRRFELFSCAGLLFVWHLLFLGALLANFVYLILQPERVVSAVIVAEIVCVIVMFLGLFYSNNWLLLPMILDYCFKLFLHTAILTVEFIRRLKQVDNFSDDTLYESNYGIPEEYDFRKILIDAWHKHSFIRNAVFDAITKIDNRVTDCIKYNILKNAVSECNSQLKPLPDIYLAAYMLYTIYIFLMIVCLLSYIYYSNRKPFQQGV